MGRSKGSFLCWIEEQRIVGVWVEANRGQKKGLASREEKEDRNR